MDRLKQASGSRVIWMHLMEWVRKNPWLFVYEGMVYGLGMIIISGLIPRWGYWYSRSAHYRAQVEAFLHGSLAISQEPSALAHDLVWANGRVQQVWGLGIPLWRLPFDVAARCVRAEHFPDMLALALGMGLAAWAVLRVLFDVGLSVSSVQPSLVTAQGDHAAAWSLARLAWFLEAANLLLLFPPFVNLLQSRFDIYEEVVAYEYLLGLGLIAGLIRLAQRPSRRAYWCLCALAGVGGLFRPTLVFHGAAAVLAGGVVLRWGHNHKRSTKQGRVALTLSLSPSDGERVSEGQLRAVGTSAREDEGARKLSWSRWGWSMAVGVGLFVFGGGILFVTNLLRFDNGFEFGHRLNVQHLYGSLYATRFDHPYQNEPLLSAGRELFALLFLARDFSGARFYQPSFFPGQSPTVRWREIYMPAYNLPYLVWLVAGLAAGAVASRKLWRSHAGKAGVSMEQRAALLTVGALALYGAVASVLLLAFYLRCEVISSRYLLDLMPSFAALMLAGWLVLGLFWLKRAAGVWVLPASAVLLAGWLGWEILHSSSSYGPPRVLTWEEVKARKHLSAGWTNPPPAGVYESPAAPAATGIPYNGAGWDKETGMVMPCVILFVSDPAFLELEVATNTAASFTPAPEQFRAKVGLEFLKREFIKRTESGWLIRFHGPQKRRYQTGLQPVFLATVPNTHMADDTTPWRLLKVRWKELAPTVQSPRANVQSRDSTNRSAEAAGAR